MSPRAYAEPMPAGRWDCPTQGSSTSAWHLHPSPPPELHATGLSAEEVRAVYAYAEREGLLFNVAAGRLIGIGLQAVEAARQARGEG